MGHLDGGARVHPYDVEEVEGGILIADVDASRLVRCVCLSVHVCACVCVYLYVCGEYLGVN